MEYRKFGSSIVARMDRGEEILTQIKELAQKEHIRLASVTALGATNDFTVGVYNVDEKKYHANEFQGNFEIVSLTGTINTMDGAFYTHIHMSAGNDRGVRRASEPRRGERHLRDGNTGHRRRGGQSL